MPFDNNIYADNIMAYGNDQDLVFNTRSSLGAIITYMDWLDTEKDNIDWSKDDYMWDQQDPNLWSSYVNIDGSVRVEELVEQFWESYNFLIESRNLKVFGFLFSRQPQVKAIK